MAVCPICGAYVEDGPQACLMSEDDPNCTLAHGECYRALEAEGGQEAIIRALEDYMAS